MKKHKQQNNFSLLILIIIVICLFGIGLGYYYSQLPENNPQRDQSSCEQAGGQWQKSQSNCLISNRIAGEPCTDGGQCQSGICFPPTLTGEQQTALSNEPVVGITGTCYLDEFLGGCIKQVIDGAVSMESLCYE